MKIQRTVVGDNGSYTEDETIYAHIPQGADSGEVIVHRRKGNIMRGTPPGDLRLQVIVEEHPHFKRAWT